LRVRIAAVEPDPMTTAARLAAHARNGHGGWGPANICNADPMDAAAFPLADGPAGTELSCTGGAIVKCVRFGIGAGRRQSMASRWRRCMPLVRMVRGDYGARADQWTACIDLYDDMACRSPTIAHRC
jgi:hypothetical protein